MKSWKSSTRQLAKGEARLRRAQHEEKILEHQMKQLTRKERTHRLCTRGAMLESFLIRPEVLTDDDVMDILKQAFSQTGMKETSCGKRERSGSRGTPYGVRAQLYTGRSRCVAPCRGPLAGEQMISADFQSAPIITGEATLPLRWLPPATPLWTCRPETPCAASCSRPASFTDKPAIFFWLNVGIMRANDKSEICEEKFVL